MPTIITSPPIQLCTPSSLTNNSWQAINNTSGKSYSISDIIVKLLIFCSIPRELEYVAKEFSAYFKIQEEKIKNAVLALIEKGLLTEAIRRDNNTDQPQYTDWKINNWASAAQYHFSTYDYKFLDYSRGGSGRQIADTRMKEYSEIKPDTNRFKEYNDAILKIKAPSFEELEQEAHGSQSHYNPVLKILSLTFAVKKEVPIRWEGAPLLRKTSPSGGSRHPTEGYLLLTKPSNLEAGLYHFNSKDAELELIKRELPKDIKILFPKLFSNESTILPSTIIILTSVFERNMFRYRDPRTFRTIHMDAGHMLGTIEIAAQHFNIESKVSYSINEIELEKYIGITGLVEGTIASVALY